MRKTFVITIVFSALFIGSESAHAAGTASSQTIDKMMVDTVYDEKLFIKTSGAINGGASCSTHPVWDFVVDTSTPLGIQMYAILLTLYKDNTPVTLSGSGTCSVFNGIETLNRIDLL